MSAAPLATQSLADIPRVESMVVADTQRTKRPPTMPTKKVRPPPPKSSPSFAGGSTPMSDAVSETGSAAAARPPAPAPKKAAAAPTPLEPLEGCRVCTVTRTDDKVSWGMTVAKGNALVASGAKEGSPAALSSAFMKSKFPVIFRRVGKRSVTTNEEVRKALKKVGSEMAVDLEVQDHHSFAFSSESREPHGITLVSDTEPPTVQSVASGSPAERAGVIPGTILCGVNSHSASNFEKATALLGKSSIVKVLGFPPVGHVVKPIVTTSAADPPPAATSGDENTPPPVVSDVPKGSKQATPRSGNVSPLNRSTTDVAIPRPKPAPKKPPPVTRGDGQDPSATRAPSNVPRPKSLPKRPPSVSQTPTNQSGGTTPAERDGDAAKAPPVPRPKSIPKLPAPSAQQSGDASSQPSSPKTPGQRIPRTRSSNHNSPRSENEVGGASRSASATDAPAVAAEPPQSDEPSSPARTTSRIPRTRSSNHKSPGSRSGSASPLSRSTSASDASRPKPAPKRLPPPKIHPTTSPALVGGDAASSTTPPPPKRTPTTPGLKLVPVAATGSSNTTTPTGHSQSSLLPVANDDDEDDFVSGDDESPVKLGAQQIINKSVAPQDEKKPSTPTEPVTAAAPTSPTQQKPLPAANEQTKTPPRQKQQEDPTTVSPPTDDEKAKKSEAEEEEEKNETSTKKSGSPKKGEMDFSLDPMEDILEKEERLGIRHVRAVHKVTGKSLSRLAQPKRRRDKVGMAAALASNEGNNETGSKEPTGSEHTVIPASDRVKAEKEAAAAAAAAANTDSAPGSPEAAAASKKSGGGSLKPGMDSYYIVVGCLGQQYRVAIDRRTLIMSIAHGLELPIGGFFNFRGMPVHTHATPITLGLRQGPERVSLLNYVSPLELEEEERRDELILDQVTAWTHALSSLAVSLISTKRVPQHTYFDAAGEFEDALGDDDDGQLVVTDYQPNQFTNAPPQIPQHQHYLETAGPTHHHLSAPHSHQHNDHRHQYPAGLEEYTDHNIEDDEDAVSVLSDESDDAILDVDDDEEDEYLEVVENSPTPNRGRRSSRTPGRRHQSPSASHGFGAKKGRMTTPQRTHPQQQFKESPWRTTADGHLVESPELIRASSSAATKAHLLKTQLAGVARPATSDDIVRDYGNQWPEAPQRATTTAPAAPPVAADRHFVKSYATMHNDRRSQQQQQDHFYFYGEQQGLRHVAAGSSDDQLGEGYHVRYTNFGGVSQ